MTNAGVTFRLLWREPLGWIGFPMAVAGLAVFAFPNPWWALLMGVPALMIAAALTMPFDGFEGALPVSQAQLLWARTLAAVLATWIPLATGFLLLMGLGRPLTEARAAVVFAAFFTGAACCATAAVSRPTLWLPAMVLAAFALRSLPWYAALGIVGVMCAATASRHIHLPARRWKPLAMAGTIWDWRTLLGILLAAWMGYWHGWAVIYMVGWYMSPYMIRGFTLTLPLSRRQLLWTLLLPVLGPYFIGAAIGYRPGPDHVANFEQPADASSWRDSYGNPPGLFLGSAYNRRSDTQQPPPIVAPWGETAQPHSFSLHQVFYYNPYWVSPENSDRFFEWQFARATRAVYGQAYRPEELRAAIRRGLVPITDQQPARTLGVLLNVVCMLAIAILAAWCDSHQMRNAHRYLRWSLSPLGIPFLLTLAAILIIPAAGGFVWQWMAEHATGLAVAAVLSLVPLYWALEKAFQQVEFPNQTKVIS